MIWMHCVECKPVSMQIMMKWSDENDDLHVNEWSIQTMMNHTEWSEIIKVTYASGKWYFWETCTRTHRGQMGAIICIPSPQRVRLGHCVFPMMHVMMRVTEQMNDMQRQCIQWTVMIYFFVMFKWGCSACLPSPEEQDGITISPVGGRRGAVFRTLCIFHNALPCGQGGVLVLGPGGSASTKARGEC